MTRIGFIILILFCVFIAKKIKFKRVDLYASNGKKLNFFRDDGNAGLLFVSYWLLEVTYYLQMTETALLGHVKS